MNPSILGAAALTASILAAGCGKSEAPPAPKAAPALAKKAADKKDDGLPPLDCPAKVDGALAGLDIVGLKLGMPREAAINFVRCSLQDKNPVTTFEGNWINGLQTYGIKLAPQVFEARIGETSECKYRNMSDMEKCGAGNRVWDHLAEKITVVSPGVPGQEKVMGIWRAQHFKAGEMPAAESLLPALVGKYGQPQSTQSTPNQWIRLDWISDPSGTPLSASTRGFGACQRVNSRAEDAQSWTEGCGQTLTAMIMLSRENPLLAKELNVGLVNQQVLFSLTDRLQHDLQALEQTRRQQEVDRSKGAAAPVKL